MEEIRQRRQALLASIALYLVACALPALILHIRYSLGAAGARWGRYESIAGWKLLYAGLFFGWIRLNFTAYANLPLWLSWIMLARGHNASARTLSVVALVMSLETLQLLVQPFLWDEGASKQGFLAAPHLGVLCWVASMALVAHASHRLMPPQALDAT